MHMHVHGAVEFVCQRGDPDQILASQRVDGVRTKCDVNPLVVAPRVVQFQSSMQAMCNIGRPGVGKADQRKRDLRTDAAGIDDIR